MHKKILLLSLFLGLLSASLIAQVRLPKLFGEGMVLQRDRAIPVWGWAGKNEKVTVQFHNQKKTARADAQGRWTLSLNPEAAGGPYTLVVQGKNNITLGDVLVGDVWICSGQSNMEWPVSASSNAAKEIQSANFPQIRHFKVVNDVAETPRDDLKIAGKWVPALPQHVGNFTAVGYFFARELQGKLGIPIGLLNTSWGGTDVETWISREGFDGSEEFRDMIRAVPRINLDSAVQARGRAVQGLVQSLQGGLPDAASLGNWSSASFDDSRWPQMRLPLLWENDRLKDMDGVVWFRKTITVSAADAGKAAELHLSMIDDNDVAYVNGVKVGSTSGYNVRRVYTVPAGVLKEGKNVIAVRVEDTGGGGGIHGEAGDLKLVSGGQAQPLAGTWSFGVESVRPGGGFANPNAFPTLLYNAMVHPLIPFAFKGVIWYQGENNAGRAYQYRTAFPLLIRDWRQRWGGGDFPFYFVQLASYNANNGNSRTGSGWAELREAQAMTLSLPQTGMAVTTDIGEPGDIHPRNKLDVGRRLASVALNQTYGQGNVFAGPTYAAMTTEGSRAVLSFTNTGGGLVARGKYGYLRGFEVAGEDQQFHYARAFVQGDKVIVSSDSVAKPVAVRFAWADDASEANLFNKEGFPAVPFRTDKWKGSTEAARYRSAR